MIRVLVVDDSPTVRARLIEILSADPTFRVIGEAETGRGAVELTAALKPDVISLDIVMPDMSGLAATEQIMAHHPTPILIVSASFNRNEMFDTYSALAAGAVDVLDKPGVDDDDSWSARFRDALRIASKIRVITHPRGRLGALGRARPPSRPPDPGPAEPLPERGRSASQPPDPRVTDIVAIGASTGGPAALSTVLSAIAPGFAAPILVVLHIHARFATAFADWLGGQTRHPTRFARAGESLAAAAGQVLVAPADTHLAVAAGRIALVDAPPRNYCRPSIDVLFESLAIDYGPRVAACLLTGMGRDGATGLLAIRTAGGTTIGQDEGTSVIYGMPREARACGAVERELPLDQIGHAITRLRLRREAP